MPRFWWYLSIRVWFKAPLVKYLNHDQCFLIVQLIHVDLSTIPPSKAALKCFPSFIYYKIIFGAAHAGQLLLFRMRLSMDLSLQCFIVCRSNDKTLFIYSVLWTHNMTLASFLLVPWTENINTNRMYLLINLLRKLS